LKKIDLGVLSVGQCCFIELGGIAMENKGKAEIIINFIPEADAYIVLEIIDKTIDLMNIKDHMSNEEFSELSEQEQYFVWTSQVIERYRLSEKLSTIFIRFAGDETPIAEALFYPIEAVWSFLETAREYYKTPGTTLSAEEIEKFSFNKAVDMFRIMLRTIHPRVMATIGSMTDETINEWYRQENESFREYYSRQGIIVPDNEPNIKKVQKNIFDDHSREVSSVWERFRKNNENFQKMRFAEEYEQLKAHWDTISFLYRGKKDWLGYAKMDGFQDTPDDLLDEMKGSHHRGMSLKALEHAARRAGLINLNCKDEEILAKRKNNIQASGFAENTLYKYLGEGRTTMETVEKQRQLDTTLSNKEELME
jgi:hypothetical protein